MNAMTFLKAATVASVLGIQFLAHACLNDRDTLEEEARNIGGANPADSFIIRAISGRFERNPRLYYEMRIKRIEKELAATPGKLELYDDIAVAHDRIGRDDEALRWIEKKRVRLAALGPLEKANATQREHWYRYYANAGTFYAHQWLHNGANRKNMADIVRARDLIQKAVKIKPNAHFGREKYQLKTIKWIMNPPSYKNQKELPNVLSLGKDLMYEGLDILDARGIPDSIKGLSGLIVLGNAWESVDIFYGLARALNADDKLSLSRLAEFRVNELIDSGKKSIVAGAPAGNALKSAMYLGPLSLTYPYDEKELPETYRRLRDEANQWHQQREAFMLARLKVGRHPDTDPNFWQGYVDPGPPQLGKPTWQENVAMKAGSIAIIVGTLLLSLLFLSRKRRDKI